MDEVGLKAFLMAHAPTLPDIAASMGPVGFSSIQDAMGAWAEVEAQWRDVYAEAVMARLEGTDAQEDDRSLSG